MSNENEYTIPKEHYLVEPTDETCYDYLIGCYNRVAKDQGDYTAFIVPILDYHTETKMSKLFADVEKLASYLAAQGLKKGDVFSVFLPTSAHAFTAFYALNKLGIIANFIHPLTPPAQLDAIMQHTKSKGMFILDLASAHFGEVMNKYLTIVCSTSDYCDGIAFKYAKGNEMQNAHVPTGNSIHAFKDVLNNDYPEVPTVKHIGKDDAIYLNGGGTTGKSKTIRHNCYAFNSLAYKLYALDTPHDYASAHALCVLPCFHAYGLIGSMHYALCNDYKPIVIPKFDAVQANELIRKFCVQEILGVPKMFQKLYEAENFENEGLKNLSLIFAGGDIITDKFIHDFNAVMIKHGAKARLGRGYGLTEMCAICTSNGGSHYKLTTTGYPILGVDLEIWDDDNNCLPAGEVGEIVCSGSTIMNGYLPDENIQESGIYTDENGKQWVKTGDMGYLDEDGYLMFSGRKKRIIIISGYNIYPSTIESEVAKLDYINEVCAVQGYDDNTGKPLVKLCMSLKDGKSQEDATEEIKKYCADNLEGYTVPRKFVYFDLLPRTKMEKIDFMKLSDKVPV